MVLGEASCVTVYCMRHREEYTVDVRGARTIPYIMPSLNISLCTVTTERVYSDHVSPQLKPGTVEPDQDL